MNSVYWLGTWGNGNKTLHFTFFGNCEMPYDIDIIYFLGPSLPTN